MNEIVSELASVKDALDEDLHVDTSALEEVMDDLEGGDAGGDELDHAAARVGDAATNVSSLIERLRSYRNRLIDAQEQLDTASADAYEREDQALEPMQEIFGA